MTTHSPAFDLLMPHEFTDAQTKRIEELERRLHQIRMRANPHPDDTFEDIKRNMRIIYVICGRDI
jgi:hypothetical protein